MMTAETTSTSTGAAPGRRRIFFEVQIHPADLRLPVRHFYVTPRTVVGYVLLTLFGLTVVLLPLLFSPRLVGGFLSTRHQRELQVEQGQLATRLRALVQRLEELHPRGQMLRSEMQKLLLAYGLPPATEPAASPSPPVREVDGVVPERLRAERGFALVDTTAQELDRVAELAKSVEFFQRTYPDRVRQTPSIRPLPADSFVLTSPFGERVNPFTGTREAHAGIDLAAPEGTPVLATADGVVAFADHYPAGLTFGWWRFGNLVAIRHGDLFLTVYGHCQSLAVKQGQRVRRGETIATVGNTGWSSNAHLHYEVRRYAPGGGLEPVDPRLYILEQSWGDVAKLQDEAKARVGLRFEPLPGGWAP